MRILADRHNRRFLIAVSAALGLFTIAAQLLGGDCRTSLLLLSFSAAAVIMLICICYLKTQDRRIAEAEARVKAFLSGRSDERIDCDEEGELCCFFHSVNTLSAVLNAQSEREKRTSEFLRSTISDISHQLKTPLSAIGIYNELIADADSLEDAKRFAASSSAELERMDTLVKNLLKLTRLDAGAIVFEKHPENIADIMGDLMQRFTCRAELEKKELRFIGGDEIFPCDAPWLAEAFGNIIKNALDHTDEGGVIEVEWKRSGNILSIIFRDDGCGIHPEDIAHIFKRFYRSRFSSDKQGLGLGLPLAKTIIEAHGGMIEVESRQGHGTVFTVNLLFPTIL